MASEQSCNSILFWVFLHLNLLRDVMTPQVPWRWDCGVLEFPNRSYIPRRPCLHYRPTNASRLFALDFIPLIVVIMSIFSIHYLLQHKEASFVAEKSLKQRLQHQSLITRIGVCSGTTLYGNMGRLESRIKKTSKCLIFILN